MSASPSSDGGAPAGDDYNSWRHWLYVNLHTGAWTGPGLSPINKLIAGLIFLAVAFAVVQSEPTLQQGHEELFRWGEIAFAVVFLAEYCARVWTAAENPTFGPGLGGRLRYMVTVPALIDLVVLVSLFITLVGSQGAILRLLRLARLIVLAKLGRYSSSLVAIIGAIKSRRYELTMSLAIAFMLLLISSTLLYMVEGPGQPDAFGSIPRAMWWSVATLTTVGYGDAVPHSILGRLFAGITAITGIGLIAMPTGILASAFSDALQQQREANEKNFDDETS